MQKSVAVITSLIVAALAAGCSSGPASKHAAPSAVAACSDPRTVYLFRGAGVMALYESQAWVRLSLANLDKPNARLLEAVIPASTTWTLRDLRLSAKDGKRVARYMKDLYDQTIRSVVAAQVCFTSWNRVTVMKLSVATGTTAQRARRLTDGLYAVAPTVVKPGGSIIAVLLRGSNDDAVYTFDPALNWYAVPNNVTRVYPVSESRTVAGNLDIFIFRLPEDIASGTYVLAPLSQQRVSNVGPGFINGALYGDFSFQVE